MYNEFKTAYSKDLLRNLLNMKPTRFKAWMNELTPDILEVDRHYSRFSKLLTPKIFRFLMSQAGIDDRAEIEKMITEYYRPTA